MHRLCVAVDKLKIFFCNWRRASGQLHNKSTHQGCKRREWLTTRQIRRVNMDYVSFSCLRWRTHVTQIWLSLAKKTLLKTSSDVVKVSPGISNDGPMKELVVFVYDSKMYSPATQRPNQWHYNMGHHVSSPTQLCRLRRESLKEGMHN